MWIAIPVLLIALGAIVWALLSGFPLGGDDDEEREIVSTESTRTTTVNRQVATDTIVETTEVTGAPNINELGVPQESEAAVTETISSRTADPQPVSRPAAATTARVPPAAPAPPAPVPPPAPARSTEPARSGELTASEAVQTLDSYLVGNNPYEADLRCIKIRNLGYRNVGYTLQVFDDCRDRALGRWRVDSKTREIFRQRSNGKYLRP